MGISEAEHLLMCPQFFKLRLAWHMSCFPKVIFYWLNWRLSW